MKIKKPPLIPFSEKAELREKSCMIKNKKKNKMHGAHLQQIIGVLKSS